MKNEERQMIIQRIQPNCDSLYQKMKDEKNNQHKTNQDIADSTGVAISTIRKFFSGALSNPGVFSVAAICIDLRMSLDRLMGIAPELPEEDPNKTAALEAKIESSEEQIALLKEHRKVLEAGIAERKLLIYGLTGLCIFLVISLVCYVGMDVATAGFGFFRNGNNHTIALVLGLIAFGFGLWHFIAKWRGMKKNGKNGSDDRESV